MNKQEGPTMVWLWMLMTFGTPMLDDLDWMVVNDTVMGGVSTATVEAGESMTFTGNLSLERNGGFTSLRARTPPAAFSGATALRLELKGDGRTYDVTLRRSDVPLRAGSYRVKVPTTGRRTVVEVPLADFRPTSFGRPVAGAPALDAALENIDTIGFMLADKNPGPFALEVFAIEIVDGAQPRAASHPTVIRTLEAAISQGVPAFNAGDVDGCRDLYAAALALVRGDRGLTLGERSVVDEALRTARDEPAREAAWTLRSAMDSLVWSRGAERPI